MHPPKSYLILSQVKKTHPIELSGLQWFSMRFKPESDSLADPTNTDVQEQHTRGPDPNEQNQTWKADRKKCFMSEVARMQADYAIYNYLTLQTSSKGVTCPYIHRTVAFTEHGEKKEQIGPFFQSYLRNTQGSKVPIAPYGRCYSVQIKDWGNFGEQKEDVLYSDSH